MSRSYAQVMKQINNLQREADDLRRKEVQGVIERIREAIAAYGLTAQDLGLAAKRGPKPKGAGPKAVKRKAGRKSARAAKYRDENGNTWGGRGPRPAWLRDALAAGKQLSDFAV